MEQAPSNNISAGTGANRQVKAGMFAEIFNNPKAALSAYNAITDSNYPPETPVEIVTLTNVLYKGRVNDLAFLLGDKLVILIEHQSTKNENIALRLLIYIASVYNAVYRADHIVYGTKAIQLREPEFYVLYNGTDTTMPAKKINKLSDLYARDGIEIGHDIKLELKVDIYNINAPENAVMVAKSKELNGYVYCIKQIQHYKSIGESNEDAIRHAVIDTKNSGYLTEFLMKHEAEAINLLFQEFDVETYGAVLKEEGRQEGQRTVAIRMLKRQRPLEEVAEDTELPLDIVRAIKQEIENAC